jgi:hypothetical protein
VDEIHAWNEQAFITYFFNCDHYNDFQISNHSNVQISAGGGLKEERFEMNFLK